MLKIRRKFVKAISQQVEDAKVRTVAASIDFPKHLPAYTHTHNVLTYLKASQLQQFTMGPDIILDIEELHTASQR